MPLVAHTGKDTITMILAGGKKIQGQHTVFPLPVHQLYPVISPHAPDGILPKLLPVKLCKALDCDIYDIIEYTQYEQEA